MVNKISGRKINAHHIEFRKLAETAEIGSVSRGQLIGLARKLERAGFIRETEGKLPLALLNTASTSSFEKGGFLSFLKVINDWRLKLNGVKNVLVDCFHVFMIVVLLSCGILVNLNAIQCEAVVMEL